MAAASREIIGREDELAGLERLLADSAHSSAALVLDGEAGIGKTTVWLEGLELASSRGLRVLAAPLDLAAAALASGRMRAACLALGAYNVLIRVALRAAFTPPERAELLAGSNRIRAVLGCA